MPSEIATVRSSWLVRALASVRAIALTSQPESAKAGSDFGGDVACQPPVQPLDMMSAMGAFAWVYVAVNLCSRDLAAVPRRVVRGEGSGARVIDDHPFVRLMRQPRVRVDGVRYARQRWADWYLSGNAYDLVLRPKGSDRPSGVPWSLQRLHPGRTRLLHEDDGDPRAFSYDLRGSTVHYDWQDVVWMGGISWQDSPSGSYGQGAIAALMRELNTELAAVDNEQRASKRGRPDFLVRPAAQEQGGRIVTWDQEQVARITDVFNRALSTASGGALVIGGASEVETLGWSPRDVGATEIHARVRDTILAVFGIPPSKAGVPGVANYATAQIEDLSYWEARRSDAALRDEADSRLAQMLGHPDDRVVSDWSGVRAFQEDRTERQNRARGFWLMGLPVREALTAEGFGAEAGMLPVVEEQVPDKSFNGAQVQSGQAIVSAVALGQLPRDSGVAMLSAFLGLTLDQAEAIMGSAGAGFVPTPPAAPPPAAEPAPRAVRSAEAPDVRTPEGRAVAWRAFEDELRGPIEAQMAARMERFLAQQLDRYVARLHAGRSVAEWAGPTRELDVEALLAEQDEMRRLLDAMGPEIQAAIRRAYAVAAKRLGAAIVYEPDRVEAVLMEELGRHVQGTTSDDVRRILGEEIRKGSSVSDMAEALRRSGTWSRARALAIARTETTRAVSAGTLQGYDDAAEAGVEIEGVMWLSARDGEVRDEHERLDGTTVDLGAEFEVDGDRARGPGEFSRVDLNVNCRCTTIPRIAGD